MRCSPITAFLAFVAFFAAFAFTLPEKTQKQPTALKWYTWEQAVELQKTAPKKVMVDMYTDWCGWCKHMDATTFADSAVVAYLQENFYPVKFNAEQKEELKFRDYNFKYVAPDGQGRGVHELAVSLLDGKLGYPSIVYLTSGYERILISPGYKDVTGMMKELTFVRDDIYKSKSFEEYKAGK
jgi:thioredoxin-related protein